MFFWQSHSILNNLLCEKDGAGFFSVRTHTHKFAHTDSQTHKATEVVFDKCLGEQSYLINSRRPLQRRYFSGWISATAEEERLFSFGCDSQGRMPPVWVS